MLMHLRSTEFEHQLTNGLRRPGGQFSRSKSVVKLLHLVDEERSEGSDAAHCIFQQRGFQNSVTFPAVSG